MYIFLISTEKEINQLPIKRLAGVKLYLKNTRHVIEECGFALAPYSLPSYELQREMYGPEHSKIHGEMERCSADQ